jgi:DNA-binding CsgD family transcriptional regulator
VLTGSRCDGSPGSGPSLPRDWADISAGIVDHLEEPILPHLLIHALGRLVPFEYGVVFVYHGKSNPIHVYDNLVAQGARAGLINYVENTYVLNPFYNAYRQGLKTGAYRIRDLAPDGFFDGEYFGKYKISAASSEEIGYLTEGWPRGREEVCIAMELPAGESAEISLSRKADDGGFSADDLARLTLVSRFLAAAFRRYWRHAGLTHAANERDSKADATLQAFGGGVLSPREQQVTRLLLRGHSTMSISLQLSISTTTVKTHRKNLYAKLGIATQFELFLLFQETVRAG